MKKKERKALEGKLLSGIKKVITDNKSTLANKSERTIKKALKQIVKRTFKDKQSLSEKIKNNKKPI